MKVSRAQAEANREHVVRLASELFRGHGFEGVGVAEIMRRAGLTHGGFYGHFAGKEDLMAEACARSFEDKRNQWDARSIDSNRPLQSMAQHYLTSKHRDSPATGCPAAALAVDAARQGVPVRAAFAAGLHGLIDFVADKLPGRTRARRRQKATAAWCTLVGAMVLARAVDNPAFSGEILRSAAAALAVQDAVD